MRPHGAPIPSHKGLTNVERLLQPTTRAPEATGQTGTGRASSSYETALSLLCCSQKVW